MIKNNPMEAYEFPTLTEINVKVRQCITTSGSGNLPDWSEENVPGSWETE